MLVWTHEVDPFSFLVISITTLFLVKFLYLLFRIHAGIDEMDLFFNIDLNDFLDVSYIITHKHRSHMTRHAR